ncbi:hypothetical protein [Amycolatopsis silviterrae]|uniref:Uncharacterized protein n=1 Tax=Amycolatopsis silviterrae TaxID=1656914 RepID=A0ABW5HBP7_9PSEU
MTAAEALDEAARTSRPAVIVVCCLLFLLILASIWLWRARRPIPPPRGRPTVRDLQARLDYEVQAEIEEARLAEFRRTAEEAAAGRAEDDTEVIPKIKDVKDEKNEEDEEDDGDTVVFPKFRKREKPRETRCG